MLLLRRYLNRTGTNTARRKTKPSTNHPAISPCPGGGGVGVLTLILSGRAIALTGGRLEVPIPLHRFRVLR